MRRVRTGEVLAEGLLRAVLRRELQDALAELERLLDGVRDALPGRLGVLGVGGGRDQPVDDDVDVVPLVAVEVELLLDVAHDAVDTHAHEAGAADRVEDLLVLPAAVAHDGREQHRPRAGRLGEDRVDDLLDGLAADHLAAVRAVGDADAGEEQPQVVVDLGHGGNRGARVLRDALLVDRDRGREAVDVVDVRLLHQAEELAGVGGERLYITPLALGVDGVERERGLAGAAEPGDDDEAITRNLDGNVLEIVLACPGDGDAVGRQRPPRLCGGGGRRADRAEPLGSSNGRSLPS